MKMNALAGQKGFLIFSEFEYSEYEDYSILFKKVFKYQNTFEDKSLGLTWRLQCWKWQVRRFTIKKLKKIFLNICPLLWAGDSIEQHQTSHSSFIFVACDYLQKKFEITLILFFQSLLSWRWRGSVQGIRAMNRPLKCWRYESFICSGVV